MIVRLPLLVTSRFVPSSKIETVISDVSSQAQNQWWTATDQPIPFPSVFSRWPLFRWSAVCFLGTRKARVGGGDERKKIVNTRWRPMEETDVYPVGP